MIRLMALLVMGLVSTASTWAQDSEGPGFKGPVENKGRDRTESAPQPSQKNEAHEGTLVFKSSDWYESDVTGEAAGVAARILEACQIKNQTASEEAASRTLDCIRNELTKYYPRPVYKTMVIPGGSKDKHGNVISDQDMEIKVVDANAPFEPPLLKCSAKALSLIAHELLPCLNDTGTELRSFESEDKGTIGMRSRNSLKRTAEVLTNLAKWIPKQPETAAERSNAHKKSSQDSEADPMSGPGKKY